MRIQLLIVCNLLLFLFVNCGPEEPSRKFFQNKIQIENTTSEKIEILAYNHYDHYFNKVIDPPILNESIVIEPDKRSRITICKTVWSPMNGANYFFESNSDSIVLTLGNNKKYISFFKNQGVDNQYWIPNKASPLKLLEEDVRKEGDVYIYSITQEDYENAHVLQ